MNVPSLSKDKLLGLSIYEWSIIIIMLMILLSRTDFGFEIYSRIQCSTDMDFNSTMVGLQLGVVHN